ncbi:MAG: tRNA dihydrouridine(20/20a) synthase DusA [Chromatiales bacterium]|nr:tRNA dihydrouridine(20/20a) synthase DusA [Chromatiales bacterium]
MLNHRFSVAPMMDWTDRHQRFFLRLISRRAVLYTEMVTEAAVRFGDRQRLLGFDAEEHPLVLQLGGSEPHEMAEAARIGEGFGYDEININVGCPSDRVQSGAFGACLMARPSVVADCVAAMSATVSVPVTVKTRIGIDERDSYDELHAFVSQVAAAGCELFVIHARKAWLQGLSPKQNREIPPLRYEVARRLKVDFPHLQIILNGGLTDLDMAQREAQGLDGVMLGRAAYHDPYLLAEVDRRFYEDEHPIPGRHEVLEAFYPYLERQLAQGIALKSISRHLLGLFQGVPGAKRWRRLLSERAHLPGAGLDLLREAADLVAP